MFHLLKLLSCNGIIWGCTRMRYLCFQPHFNNCFLCLIMESELVIWLLRQVERRNIYLQKSREWLADRPARYMWSPWKCSFCSGKDSYKTTTLTEDQNIPEGVLMKEKGLLYRKKKSISDDKAFLLYLLISQIIFLISSNCPDIEVWVYF